MKYVVWILSALNLYFGFDWFLNSIHVLQTSKYSQSSTVIFAIIFLTMGACGFYFSIFKQNDKLALLITFGPWILMIIILFITMMTSDYK